MKPSIIRSLCCTALGAAFILAPLTTMAETPVEKGEKFLAENKSKEGVKTTASGLVHYEGKLLDGTIFDSSIKRGEPIAFPLNRVIPGWTEGLQLIKEGGKAILYIPSKLAYGPGGTPGGPIGPNETLIFEVELIKIQ